jgi:predicted amidophosphoribosyltransferase
MRSGPMLLVPVPRSQPLEPGALWPALRIAEELARRGVAPEVRPLLVRKEAIVKSALLRTAAARPQPMDHARTIYLEGALPFGLQRIVLVDDVVTRGATLVGCAAVIAAALPEARVCGFAAVRTMSDQEVDTMLAPVCGTISFRSGRLHREP